MEEAFSGRAGSGKLTKDGRIYQLSVNPVANNNNNNSSGNNNGHAAVLLAADITEKHEGKRMRREFSANVSHELKTPLTSISGYAEIIANGIVRQEDHERFARQIHSEAQRLISLVDDIIRLSRLDEGAIEREFKPVDLGALCERVIASLADKAADAGVKINLEGGGYISGIEGTLGEMIYNLCDNAIIYNRSGGSVTVGISDGVLTVSDTGMGIAPEHQGRIFERFYRADRSRSKNTGGTGLGLLHCQACRLSPRRQN
jgi:two-component system phosphate regulon sensor histidine kinase PhoR